MKTILVTFLFLFCLIDFSYAQNQKITTGFEVAVRSSQQLFDEDTNIESENQLGFSLSGTVFFDVNAWYQIKTGINFSFYNIEERDYSIVLGCDSDGAGGVNVRNSFYALDYRFLYLGIPIENKFKLFGDVNHIYAKAGVEFLFNISTAGSTSLHECGSTISELSDPIFSANNFGVSTELGLGYELAASKKTKIYFEPLIELWLSKVFEKRRTILQEDAINNSRLLSFGLAAGVRF